MGVANNDTGSKDWLKERAAISAAHRRQKTDPAASKLVDQLHKERIQGNAEETVDEEYEDLDAITSVPPPEEIVVKVVPKENTTTTLHGKETSEDVQSFMKSVLEGGLATESSLELSFDLKPEDIKIKDLSEGEEVEEEDENDNEGGGEEEDENNESIKIESKNEDEGGNEDENDESIKIESKNEDEGEKEDVEINNETKPPPPSSNDLSEIESENKEINNNNVGDQND